MKHTNNTPTINKRTENLLLLLIILIGSIGGAFSLSGQKQAQQTPAYYASVGYVGSGQRSLPLEVEGTQLVGRKLRFEIRDFKRGETYVINFGNGVRQMVEQPQFLFSYQEHGHYEIQLEQLNKGTSLLLYSRTIDILPENKLERVAELAYK